MRQRIGIVDDYNGLWRVFTIRYPTVARHLLAGPLADRFWHGINSVSLLGHRWLFVETPSHGWIVDSEGHVVGEEDCGFTDRSFNTDLVGMFRDMKTIIG